ncbi:MAG: nucleotidyltransferase domain-containing protein [Alkalimonas sp.]|nr:nucleotidyltransferase domain-containing protein [Alkalimonas sp.]
MRLTEYEKIVILDAVAAEDENAQVFVFGSRANDNSKGGDIDLLIVSEKFSRQNIRNTRWRIQEQLGEQKIDIVATKDGHEAFVQLIKPQAQELA